MNKNKIINYTIFTLLVFGLFFGNFSLIRAESVDSSNPDNVKITTSPDGSSTTVIINSKPGFTTSVETNCVNGKCTHKTTSKEITKEDIKKMEDKAKKQQEALEKFWKIQNELFRQQQEMFNQIWGINI